MKKQLSQKLSHRGQSLSSPSSERLRAWRLFFESAVALLDVLDGDFERDAGFPIQVYDVLVHLEDTPDGLRMNELAEKILYSKSGLTRVIDRMEKAGLVRRHRPENDRRSIFVIQTPKGRQAMERTRPQHHDWIEQNFSGPLTDTDIKALTRAFEKLSTHARTRRPGRVTG
jgi:DNA-binding MarR family transcriptional regulator